MGKARRLYDIGIKTVLDIVSFRELLQQTLGKAAAHLRDFQRVGQAVVEEIWLFGFQGGVRAESRSQLGFPA